jgi:hypothetical protein
MGNKSSYQPPLTQQEASRVLATQTRAEVTQQVRKKNRETELVERRKKTPPPSFTPFLIATHGTQMVEVIRRVIFLDTTDNTIKEGEIYETNYPEGKEIYEESADYTYNIILKGGNILKGVQKTNIREFLPVEEESIVKFEIPSGFKKLYKINLVPIGECVEIDFREFTKVNNIIRDTYTEYSHNIETFVEQVIDRLKPKFPGIAVMDCLESSERMMANKYYVLEPTESASLKNGKYEDFGIFSLSPKDSEIDFFKKTCIDNSNIDETRAIEEKITELRQKLVVLHHNAETQFIIDQKKLIKNEITKLNDQIRELKKYDTKEYRQITLKELFKTIHDKHVENAVFVDVTCNLFTVHDSKEKIGLRRGEVHEFEKLKNLFHKVDEETGFIIPYGGKKKNRKTKIRKPKRRKTKGKTQKVKII